MNEKCYEIGVIQAFLDGEISPALSFEITNHSAACDKCAIVIAQADEENAQVFAMLDREMNTLVPTQRLWSSISVAIAEEKRQHSFWDRIRSGILATFANPSISVAAGVLVVFGLFAAVWTLQSPESDSQAGLIAGNLRPAEVVQIATTGGDAQPFPVSGEKDFGVNQSSLPPAKIRDLVQPAAYKASDKGFRPQNAVLSQRESAADGYLPGEESYVRTIANLKENVDSRKDTAMSPSVRISYERDMAVVNDSIKKMKDVVRRNPKNQAAKQVLYSSYQNKIDLLNSIVDREELMASMQ